LTGPVPREGITADSGKWAEAGPIFEHFQKKSLFMIDAEWKQLRDLIEELDRESGWAEEQSKMAEENARTASSVKELLEKKGHIPPQEAHVVSRQGQVTLSGEVSWLRGMSQAECAILRLPGVSGLTNRLTVRPCDSANDLKDRVVEALESRAHRIASRIRVERHDGVVTLRGNPSSVQYRDLAGQVAACAPGVKRVENLIDVNPPA
jgi:osmotically-inducible protein OsmY